MPIFVPGYFEPVVWGFVLQAVLSSLVPVALLMLIYWLVARAQGEAALERFRTEKLNILTVLGACAVLGGIIGVILGVSVSPVAQPLATGIFGLIGALALYIFGQDKSAGWMVGAAAVAFSLALLVNLLAANRSSLPSREYDFCVKAFADPKADEKVICRLREHCENRLPEYYKARPVANCR